MSEEPENTATSAEGNSDVEAPSEILAIKDDRDWFLQSIIRLANLGLGIGLTVVAEGAIVSGTLIGGKQYFEELGAEIGKANYLGDDGTNVLKAIGDSWIALGQRYVKPADAPADWTAPEPGFLHLKNARVYIPGQPGMPSNHGVLWRGKLNAISGFSLGSFDHVA